MFKRLKNRPPLFFIYLTIFVNIIGFGMVFPLLPFYAEQFNASGTVIGVIAASFAVAQFLFSPIWGRLSDHFGRKPIISLSLLGNSIAFLVFGFADNLWWLFISRFMQGVFSAAALPVAQAYVADVTSKEERIKGMGNLGASLAIGFIFGPAIGGNLATINISLPFFAASVVALINLVSVQIFLPESLTQKSPKITLKEGLVNPRNLYFAVKGEMGSLFILVFLWSYALSNNQVSVPLLASERLHLSAATVGMFFSLMGATSALVQAVLLHKITPIVGEHKTSIIGLSIMATALLLMPFSPLAAAMAICMMTVSLGSGLARPTINTLISKETKQGQGATMGVATSFESLGRVFGPLLGGWLFSSVDYHAPFTLTAFLLVITLLFVVRQKHFLRRHVPMATGGLETSS